MNVEKKKPGNPKKNTGCIDYSCDHVNIKKTVSLFFNILYTASSGVAFLNHQGLNLKGRARPY